jgi:hypothetical protein
MDDRLNRPLAIHINKTVAVTIPVPDCANRQIAKATQAAITRMRYCSWANTEMQAQQLQAKKAVELGAKKNPGVRAGHPPKISP